MAVLESCPKQNMVAYLEKTDANAEFHEIIDFLTRSSIYYALTVIAGKPVSISEASIRSDLLFDDVDGIDYLPNQAIFDAIQLMELNNVPVPLDHFPVNAFTKDEGEELERPSESQPTPYPLHPSEVHVEPQSNPSPRPSPTIHIPNSNLEDSGGNHGDQANQIKHLKAQIKKLKKQAKPVIAHHKAWVKSMSLKQRLAGNKSLKKQWMQKESVSKQGRKPTKAEPSVHKDLAFDELADDTLDYMETEDAQDVRRIRNVVNEEKETANDEVSTEDALSTAQQKVSTNKEKPDEGTDGQTEGRNDPQTPPTTTTPFDDDETIAQVVVIMSQNKEKLNEKEKGVELKDVEETKRPRPSSTRSLLTLKPLLKIDPKDNSKKKIEEEDESNTEFEAEEEIKKLAKEEAIKTELSNKYDFIQARIEADRLLALRLQDEERESSSL
ncbi:hypothetical protein Tco_0603781 [Tanacetum coccineum]